jgi:hypothetical protein
MEDLNYLYYRQQVSIMAAEAAGNAEARVAHNALARAYGHRIAAARSNIARAFHRS